MIEFVATFDDGLVVYEGKVFEAGDYPDKDFAIDEAELTASAQQFQGVDLDLEHSAFKDVLGNKLGRLEAVWNRGRDAIGRLRIPRWLHELAGGRLQTSLSFDRKKRIVGCALTLSPRIADAEVAAAFARFTAEPDDPHDLAAPNGAACEAQSASSSAAGGTAKETDCMTSLKDRLRVLFGKAPEAVHEAGIDPHELDRIEFTEPEPKPDPAIQAQLAEFKAANDRLIASQLNVAAAFFADEIVRSAKAVPAQREHLISLYKTAATVDGQGVIRFSEAGQIAEGPNLKALRDLFKDAQPHSLFSTQIRNADPNSDASTPDPAMVERLRGATSLGQQTVAGARASADRSRNLEGTP
jgi:hypothetical protein